MLRAWLGPRGRLRLLFVLVLILVGLGALLGDVPMIDVRLGVRIFVLLGQREELLEDLLVFGLQGRDLLDHGVLLFDQFLKLAFVGRGRFDLLFAVVHL